MITFLEGKLDSKQLAHVVMNVGGVGYEVTIPLSSYDQLPLEGESCRILTYHHITDVSQKLFGFCTDEEREMFRRLLTISGVGPKLAVSALSGLPVRELKNALINGDVKRISSISGIGKKTAERVILELRDKLKLDSLSPGEAEETWSSFLSQGPRQCVSPALVEGRLYLRLNKGLVCYDLNRSSGN